MKERLQELIKHLGISSSQFADSIDVQRSSISHILSGRNKPSYDFIIKILRKYPEINAQWLLLGEGVINIQSNNKNETEPIAINKDLFTKTIENTNKEENDNNISTLKQASNKTTNKLENLDEIQRFTNVNSVKQIIFIYENNTFEVIQKK